MYDEREFWRIEAETNSIRQHYQFDIPAGHFRLYVRQADKRSECRNVRFD